MRTSETFDQQRLAVLRSAALLRQLSLLDPDPH